ncbi:MAG: hypothetical protein QF483_08725 [Gammaproteobacteria bacterium]|jgi:hypothetical protein|nr:hypothetical protein [Gammaproteobacteria bacterium]
MTHRIPSRRWQDNPQRRVSKAQLNRVEQATQKNELKAVSLQHKPARKPEAGNHDKKR